MTPPRIRPSGSGQGEIDYLSGRYLDELTGSHPPSESGQLSEQALPFSEAAREAAARALYERIGDLMDWAVWRPEFINDATAVLAAAVDADPRAPEGGSTGVQPSAEARKLAAISLNSGWHGKEHPCSTSPCEECYADGDRTLAAAYAIDAPAIHAAGVRSVIEWLFARAEDRKDSTTTYAEAVKDAAAYALYEFTDGDPSTLPKAVHAAGVEEGREQMRRELERAVETRENANAVSLRLEADMPRLIAQAEARGRAAERAAIVKWLRHEEDSAEWPWAADAIEQQFGGEQEPTGGER